MAPGVETERLWLRPLGPQEAGLVAGFFARNRAFLQEWEPARSADFFSAETQARLLAEECQKAERGESLRLWLFRKGENARIIGSVSFSNIVRGSFLSCHLGYRLDEGETGRGYATEAVRRGIAVMFDDYQLHRIEANIMPRNRRSLRVVEKLGFCNEGRSPQYLKINGRWEDHIHMVRLNEMV